MKILYKNKHWNIPEDYNIDKILYLLIDRPTYIDSFYDFIWENEVGEWHREYDLPAVFENNNINIEWCKNNNFHRENNKSAIIYTTGNKHYYVNGNFVKEKLK